MMRRCRGGAGLALAIWAVAGLTSLVPASSEEVQRHGVLFERWIRDTFFGGYQPENYTQLWDIPADVNIHHGGVAVNPKAAKYGSPVDLGDALRQHGIEEPFLLVVGFWEQDGPVKRFVNVQAVRVEPGVWRNLWGPVTRSDLERLDALVKDPVRDIASVRRAAQAMKRQPPFSRSVIQVNPKIDAKQRRLQCSLRFRDLFEHLAPAGDRGRTNAPRLFGVPLPAELASPPRQFRRAGAP